MKYVSLHIKVSYALKAHFKREAGKEGLPLSLYMRRILHEVAFNQLALLKGEITDGKA